MGPHRHRSASVAGNGRRSKYTCVRVAVTPLEMSRCFFPRAYCSQACLYERMTWFMLDIGATRQTKNLRFRRYSVRPCLPLRPRLSSPRRMLCQVQQEQQHRHHRRGQHASCTSHQGAPELMSNLSTICLASTCASPCSPLFVTGDLK